MPLGFLLIEQLPKDPVYYVSVVFAVVLSIVLHELGHGVAAIRQGDDTPILTGHMTWDPMVHMGGFSLVMLFVVGIAFGRMPVSPMNFRGRRGRAVVALAGPAVNLVLALIGLTVLAVWIRAVGWQEEGMTANFQQFFYILGYLNLVLFAFNLLPIPPLDGATILADFSPGYAAAVRNPNNQPFFLGGFILVFMSAGHLFTWASEAAGIYVALWL